MRRNMIGGWKRQLLILLINQQLLLLCSGSWATSTAATPVKGQTPTTPTPTPPLVSASEATLLTSQLPAEFQLSAAEGATTFEAAALTKARSAAEMSANEVNWAAGADDDHEDEDDEEEEDDGNNAAQAFGTEANEGAPPPTKNKNRYTITAIHTNCTRDLFEMRLQLNAPFRGLLYAKDFPLECRARGSAAANVSLRLPTSGCGVRVEPQPLSGHMEFSVRVMLQTEQKLRQSSDIERTVRCRLSMNAMTPLPEGMGSFAAPPESSSAAQHNRGQRNGRMRTLGASLASPSADKTVEANAANNDNGTTAATTTTRSATTATPRVRIWLELGGPGGTSSVELGQATDIIVRAIVPDYMGVRVVDCAALDGLGESKQQLLDERGCPIDEQVMPPLHTRTKPLEEGWSKHSQEDLVEKTFAATFPAFKFPDRERLHVSCGVQLCKGQCPSVNCRTAERLVLSGDRHLARIEVFNSLAVTAPQIEVDRLTYDRRYNMSAEEQPPYVRQVHGEGTLCLSVSKLAIAFCTLGLIFLMAVFVAVFSLLRSRRRASRQRGRLGGSSSSSADASLGRCRSVVGGVLRCSRNRQGRQSRNDHCTSMFSSSSESAHSARFGSKLFMPYYPNTLPYGRVY